MSSAKPAGALVLKSGKTFKGRQFGFPASVLGEVVFNTGMVGYPESLTDPSYRGQILVLTYPLIGNYGVPEWDGGFFKKNKVVRPSFESRKIQVAGLIVGDESGTYSHWKARRSLGEWLKKEKIPALTGVDTRALTRLLRERGVMSGGIVMGSRAKMADTTKKLSLRNLVGEVSMTQPIRYEPSGSAPKNKKHVILIDCGVKNNIIYSFLARGCEITRVPWDFDATELLLKADGVVISNGPGDPKACRTTIRTVKSLLQKKTPILGICLGSQIMALAAGASTYKLKYGHRSQNQPCMEIDSKRCFMTTHNHGYAVRESSLPREWKPWFRNLNDGTNEGFRHNTKPFLAVQFHPEATPGPEDTQWIFDEFLKTL